ncbi:TetR/AcrR family transcriptional regulator [Nocardia jiangsuensis]|uniref:TetR/AcrR family transcriptional regulator n=1 Tax=Nocardia jiangsuensis TaxID=1691563 RepID=A0ABV8DYU8_9NOCA
MARNETATRTPRRQRRERGSITAEEIVEGAYSLAAEISVEKLSMPALARRLDSGVTSLYWYFRSKEQLLEAMRDRALEQYEIALPFTGDGAWHERLRHHFLQMRALFRDNPVLCDLLIMPTAHGVYDGNGNVGRVTYQRLETIVETLVQDGFDRKDALDTYYSMSMHSCGFAMLERREGLAAARDPSAGPPVDRESMPNLAGLVEEGYRLTLIQDHIFEIGLDALLDKAKKTLARSG